MFSDSPSSVQDFHQSFCCFTLSLCLSLGLSGTLADFSVKSCFPSLYLLHHFLCIFSSEEAFFFLLGQNFPSSSSIFSTLCPRENSVFWVGQDQYIMEILIKDIKILRRNSEEIIILKNAWLLTILSSYESRIINFVNDLFMVSLLKEYLFPSFLG